MGVIWRILEIATLLYLIALVARAVISFIPLFSRQWRPRGVVAMLAEVVYTVTDPPLRALGKLIPPVRLGAISLDVSFMIVFIVCSFSNSVFGALARAA